MFHSSVDSHKIKPLQEKYQLFTPLVAIHPSPLPVIPVRRSRYAPPAIEHAADAALPGRACGTASLLATQPAPRCNHPATRQQGRPRRASRARPAAVRSCPAVYAGSLSPMRCRRPPMRSVQPLTCQILLSHASGPQGPIRHAESAAHSLNLPRPLSASGILRPFGCPNKHPADSGAVTSAPRWG